MRTGLAASTVTPGRTAPVLSVTSPAIALCAEAVEEWTTSQRTAIRTDAAKLSRVICALLNRKSRFESFQRRSRINRCDYMLSAWRCQGSCRSKISEGRNRVERGSHALFDPERCGGEQELPPPQPARHLGRLLEIEIVENRNPERDESEPMDRQPDRRRKSV